MPVDYGAKNLPVRAELVTRSMKRYEELKKKKPDKAPKQWGSYVNDIIQAYLDKEDFLERVAPCFDYVNIQDNVMFIKDIRKAGTIEIYVRDSELWCSADRSKDCDHIHYALMRPEVAKMQLKRPRA